MKKVFIIGFIKVYGKTKSFQEEGYMKDNLFYPSLKNVRIYYKVVKCHRQWDNGILADYIEVLEDD